MRFYEFEAKRLLARLRVPMPQSELATTAEEAEAAATKLDGPVVLKSQVLSGGRMKAGGVKFADTPAEAKQAAAEILPLEINDLKAVGVLVEEKRTVAQEYFAAVTWDTREKQPVIIFSDMGGIDIEEVAETHPEHVARVHFSPVRPFSDFTAKVAVAQVGITGGELNALSRIVAALARTFIQYDLTLAEINPIGRLDDGSFLALDSHMDMEDEARGAHGALLADLGIDDPEQRKARPPSQFELDAAANDEGDPRGIAGNLVEFDGDIGLIIGAGGGSLTLFDAVRGAGGKPANYCEIGGNPSVGKAAGLTRIVLEQPGVERIAVMMSIVSNTRVDIVARGVIKGCIEAGRDPADAIAIFRIPGSWEEEGVAILDKYGVEYVDRSVSMHEAAARAVAKVVG
ncbi:MAG TPA: ATP-grasp domain-containing protein [Dehalococcoidia bacterium]|nr:ATP-grasp domain-containing protein [Dehalococcoidia bacterium]